MSGTAPSVSWENVSEPMAREILARGDKFLEAQMQLAIAADQRATTSASILVSVAAATAAAFIAFWGTSNDSRSTPGWLGELLRTADSRGACWLGQPDRQRSNLRGTTPRSGLRVGSQTSCR